MSIAATRYAKALVDVLYPSKSDAGLQQLRDFSTVLSNNPNARLVFENPTVSTERRKDLLNKIAGAIGLETPVRNFLNLLIERNRLNLLNDVLGAYQTQLDARQNIVRAHVSSAMPLDAEQQGLVAKRLEKLTGKTVRMDVLVDPSLIGGFIAQVGSTIYDGSVRQRLHAFKHTLTQD